MMTKLFAIITSFLAIGVIFVGAGNVMAINYENVSSNTIGMNSNASFIAPMPVNISLPQYLLPHEIWFGSPEFFVIMEGR